MRWENLFDDLEGQLELELGADEVDLHAEEERFRLSRLSLRDRMRKLLERAESQNVELRIELVNGSLIGVHLRSLGKDWLLGSILAEAREIANCLIPISKVASVALPGQFMKATLTYSGREDQRELADRLGFGLALRDLVRKRAPVSISVGTRSWHGTIDRVGRDHLDLAVHEVGVPRRESGVLEYRMIALDQIMLVRF